MKNKGLHRINDVFYNVNMLEGAIPVVRADGMFVIRNFTIIRAGLSANRNFYPEETLRRDYRKFEGVKIRTDHPSSTRDVSVRDTVGKAENVRFSESDKTIRGDAVFSSVESDLVTKIKENLIGDMSINAFGSAALEKGLSGGVHRRIKAIQSANSIDLVCEASAGGSLHEEVRQTTLICERMVNTMAELENVTLDELINSRPDLVEGLKTKFGNEIVAKGTPLKTETAPVVSLEQISNLFEEKVKGVVTEVTKTLDARDAAAKLAGEIGEVVEGVIEESTMIDEVKPIVRKELQAFATKSFTSLASIDKVKLSEARDAHLKNLIELSKAITEKGDGAGKQKVGTDAKKKSVFTHSV